MEELPPLRPKHPVRRAILVVSLIILGWGAVYFAKRNYLQRINRENHPYANLAENLRQVKEVEWCDRQMEPRRRLVAQVLDRYRSQIQELWAKRKPAPEFRGELVPLGPIQLRKKPPAPAGPEFDEVSWSWEEAAGLIQKTQIALTDDERESAWRDFDSVARYLFEKDVARLVRGRKFVEPSQTEHTFRPNAAVQRTGRREFTVSLDAGPIAGHEATLARILEGEWRGRGFQVRLRWVKNDSAAYRIEPNLRSGRSQVDHRRRLLILENFASTKTVAHELGHVLGFDDHYYNVWNTRNCYYTQKARNADLMSNSDRGHVSPALWSVLDRAYPWKGERVKEPFGYFYREGI